MSERKRLMREIYEYGEVERDAERTAQFAPHGGLFYRFFMWAARRCRSEREALREKLRAMDADEKREVTRRIK